MFKEKKVIDFEGNFQQLLQNVTIPTMVIDKEKCQQNIIKMAEKAAASSVIFRPHFKTHQSAVIGEWFREVGCHSITVSSVDMALYFLSHGWDDTTIAFPVNMREMDKINYLAGQCKLGVLVDSIEILNYLTKQIQHPVKVWVEVDAGYPRSGIPWHEVEQIQALIDEIEQSPLLRLGGLLSHFGQTYLAKSKLEIISIHREAVKRLNKLKNTLRVNVPLNISIGDTPSCSVVERFEGVDEIRPGNFVFYDLMQLELGSCVEGDISAMVACPVVSIQRQRSEIVLYGGAVHLSKEVLTDVKGQNHYGNLVEVREDGWGHLRKNCSVTSLSQEHGIVHLSDEFIEEVKVGDAVLVAPVHSCLVADLISHYYVF